MNISRIQGVFSRYFIALYRGSHALADLFYWPLLDILLWGLTSVWIENQQNVPKLPLILMTGLIFWQVTWRGSIDISSNLLLEFWNRNLVNLFATPLTIMEWSIGVLLLSLVKLCITISFGTIVVYILYSLNVFTVGWIFLPCVAILICFGFAVGFFTSGVIIYWGQQVESLAWIFAAMFAPFSAVFYPVSSMPFWFQKICWSLPTTYVFEGMRQVLKEGRMQNSYLFIAFGLTFFYVILAYIFFAYMFEKSRNKGLGRLE